jgi:glutamate-5-semialdehyde dehydrogenase
MLKETGKRARAAARLLARSPSETKARALRRLAESLAGAPDEILAANARDLDAGHDAGLSAALLDRLTLTRPRLDAIASDLAAVAAMPDPVGETFDASTLPNGLRIHKQRVPLGVLAVIYESRPNVTVDVAGLSVKTGNAAILRGGSEALHSNRALVRAVHAALVAAGLPADAIQFIDDPDRALVNELLHLHEYVDLVIPRGGNALHEFCRLNSTIPVITGGIGICHLFVDETADREAALEVIHNAKTQRPTVCNALDTVLVHRALAADFLPQVVARLSSSGVTFRADASALPYLAADGAVVPAGPDDFDTEWLSLVLGLKVVASLDDAVEHIARHSTGHSDGILTRDGENAGRFVAEVDSAAVYVNASTRFTDGGQLGLGAEAAVSTQRLHARGPMGLRELTTYKWVITGDYHVRQP